MARKLTKKQRGFVKDYVESGNGTQAALKNYDVKDEHVAAVIASENLIKPEIVKSIQEALPNELLAQVHLEGLHATRSVLFADGDGINDVPDYAVRHKYLDSAYKIKGTYAPEKHVSLVAQVGASDRIKQLADKLLAAAHGQILISEGESISERTST